MQMHAPDVVPLSTIVGSLVIERSLGPTSAPVRARLARACLQTRLYTLRVSIYIKYRITRPNATMPSVVCCELCTVICVCAALWVWHSACVRVISNN